MKLRTVLLAVAATSALSTGAFAASNPHDTNHPSSRAQLSDRCAALEIQLDQAIASHGSATKAAAAKTLRSKGGNLCSSNQQASGIKTLEQALKDLGVKPRA